MFKMNSSEHFSSSTTSSRAIEGNTNNNNINISAASSSGSNCKTSSKDLEKLSVEIRKYPGDLVQGPTNSDQDRPPPRPPSFRKVGKESKTEQEDPEDEDLELSLGLSLGGKFGVDKSHMGLMRSSSISGNFPLIKEDDTLSPPPSVAPALVRTSSLPVETEEEWRKRKEVQQLRRLAAKRRRSEKQRSSKESLGDASGSAAREDAKLNLNVRGRLEKEQQHFMSLGKKLSSSVASSFGSNLFVGSGGGGGGVGLKKISFFSSLQGLLAQQGSQGSGESQGCSSSGASEPEIKSVQGSSEARSPSSIQSQQERGASEVTCSGNRNPDPPSTQPVVTESRRQDDMPCVFTIGDPPRGRKVEGILYKYGKGEEVRIMCICHGSFFSPAEFVEHAGRRDVEHPLRHIVVNPSSSPFQ